MQSARSAPSGSNLRFPIVVCDSRVGRANSRPVRPLNRHTSREGDSGALHRSSRHLDSDMRQ